MPTNYLTRQQRRFSLLAATLLIILLLSPACDQSTAAQHGLLRMSAGKRNAVHADVTDTRPTSWFVLARINPKDGTVAAQGLTQAEQVFTAPSSEPWVLICQKKS